MVGSLAVSMRSCGPLRQAMTMQPFDAPVGRSCRNALCLSPLCLEHHNLKL